MMYPQKDNESIESIIKSNQKWNVLEDFVDSHGNKHNVATTRTMFWTPPRILMFSIKMYDAKYRVKLDEELDLDPFIHPDSEYKNKKIKYSLFAMCSHIGSTRSGHYVAYTKHKNQWYFKDDICCRKVDIMNVCECFYIIMYKIIKVEE